MVDVGAKWNPDASGGGDGVIKCSGVKVFMCSCVHVLNCLHRSNTIMFSTNLNEEFWLVYQYSLSHRDEH